MAARQSPQRWLTRVEAAEYLGVTFDWIRAAMVEGRIPYYKFNRLVRFDQADLDNYIAAQRREGVEQR
jgi:excisionase family DNA binding protein